MSEYIGNRIVPRHDGVWDKAKEYEPLTIVYEESTGDSYMSRKPVPAGTLLSQEEYWAMCSRFSEQMALYRQNTAEEVEQFRKDTAADVEQLRTDTASDVAALRKMTAQDVADITQKVDAANSAVAASKSEMDKTAETLKAQINANVKASTDKNANYAQELVDARVDDEGKTYPTAGDNIRAVGRVRSMQNIMKNWVIKNGYANQNGNLVASESWRVAHMVPVSGDAILVDGQFGYMSGRNDYNNVVCYDMDRKFLGGCFRAESGKVYDNYVITLLPNTRFISVTTNEKLFSKLSVYLYDNMLPLRLLSNYATGWQWMNGSVDIRFTGSKVTVTFPEGKSVYVCRRTMVHSMSRRNWGQRTVPRLISLRKAGGQSITMEWKYLLTKREKRLNCRSLKRKTRAVTGAVCSQGTALCLQCFMTAMLCMRLRLTVGRLSTESIMEIRRKQRTIR